MDIGADLSPEVAPPYREHLGNNRQYWRDIILGVNDGLVSMFLLVAGVVGGALSTSTVLLTGISGAIAGSISMAAGEFMATKSQEEVCQREIELEREHFKYHREHELDELREMFGEMGLEDPLLEDVVQKFNESDDALMKIMMALEFGVVEEERRSPWAAAFISGLLFLAGAAPSVVPFAFTSLSPNTALAWAAVFSGLGLFAVGAAKTWATMGNWFKSGLENLAVAAGGAVLSYLVGAAYERSFGG